MFVMFVIRDSMTRVLSQGIHAYIVVSALIIVMFVIRDSMTRVVS
jgi:hypothetical protein